MIVHQDEEKNLTGPSLRYEVLSTGGTQPSFHRKVRDAPQNWEEAIVDCAVFRALEKDAPWRALIVAHRKEDLLQCARPPAAQGLLFQSAYQNQSRMDYSSVMEDRFFFAISLDNKQLSN